MAKFRWSCSDRTVQSMSISSYESNGKIFSSIATLPKVDVLDEPNKVSMFTMVCAPDFLMHGSTKLYVDVIGNDILLFTRLVVKNEDLKTNSTQK